MSNGTSPWGQIAPEQRRSSGLSNIKSTTSSSLGIRGDAAPFNPGVIGQAVAFMPKLRTDDEAFCGTTSPFYPVQSTWLPPDTPPLPHTPSLEVTFENAGSCPSSSCTIPRCTKQGNGFMGLGIAHTPGSTWAPLSSESFEQSNHRSYEKVFGDLHHIRGGEVSHAHTDTSSSNSPDNMSPLAQRSSVSSIKSGSLSDRSKYQNFPAPSPRRQLFPQQGVSDQGWLKLPETFLDDKKQLAAHGRTAPSGKETPGGVKLPSSLRTRSAVIHPLHLVPQRVFQQSETTISQWNGLSSLGQDFDCLNVNPNLVAPTHTFLGRLCGAEICQTDNGGNISAEYQLRAGVDRYGWTMSSEQHASFSNSTSTAPSSGNPNRAKSLADFIKAGGAENGGRAATVQRRACHRQVTNAATQVGRQPVLPVSIGPDPIVQQWKHVKPTWNELISNLPLEERGRCTPILNHGVVRIGDTPYDSTKAEVIACLGEKIPLVKMPSNTGKYAIHIIMERATGKSNDCYVELESPEAAQKLVDRIERHGRRMVRIRRVTIELSSQEALMKELLPKAKCVHWNGCQPFIVQPTDPRYSTGFTGFVSSEELVFITKYAQNPQRSRYAGKQPHRTYESMISLLFKYPWFAVENYTLKERDLIFNATCDQLKALTDGLYRGHASYPLTHDLLDELLDAGLKCPGFSEKQRAQLIDATQGYAELRAFVSPLAPQWPFETLRRKDDVSEELVLYFADLLKAATVPASLAARAAAYSPNTSASPFGGIRFSHNEKMTMADVAKSEWNVVEALLVESMNRT